LLLGQIGHFTLGICQIKPVARVVFSGSLKHPQEKTIPPNYRSEVSY